MKMYLLYLLLDHIWDNFRLIIILRRQRHIGLATSLIIMYSFSKRKQLAEAAERRAQNEQASEHCK